MAADSTRKTPRDDAATTSSGKRPYSKPRLQEYGSIAKLTQSGGTTKPESPTMRACL